MDDVSVALTTRRPNSCEFCELNVVRCGCCMGVDRVEKFGVRYMESLKKDINADQLKSLLCSAADGRLRALDDSGKAQIHKIRMKVTFPVRLSLPWMAIPFDECVPSDHQKGFHAWTRH